MGQKLNKYRFFVSDMGDGSFVIYHAETHIVVNFVSDHDSAYTLMRLLNDSEYDIKEASSGIITVPDASAVYRSYVVLRCADDQPLEKLYMAISHSARANITRYFEEHIIPQLDSTGDKNK